MDKRIRLDLFRNFRNLVSFDELVGLIGQADSEFGDGAVFHHKYLNKWGNSCSRLSALNSGVVVRKPVGYCLVCNKTFRVSDGSNQLFCDCVRFKNPKGVLELGVGKLEKNRLNKEWIDSVVSGRVRTGVVDYFAFLERNGVDVHDRVLAWNKEAGGV